MALPKKSEVNRLIRLWQKRLRLDGWIIEWSWVQQEALDQQTGYAAIAATGFDVSELKASIDLSKDIQWTLNDFYSDHNLEDTIVHELLHIRLGAADEKLDVVRQMLGTAVSTEQGRVIGQMLIDARERYIESTRTIIQEAQWNA